jgi:hypothetical protein
LISEQHTGLVGGCQQTDRNQMERSGSMKPVTDFSLLCESFFSKRLITQRKASSHTVSAYAQTFRLFIAYAQKRLRTPPAMLSLAQLDASFVAEFLDNFGIQPVQWRSQPQCPACVTALVLSLRRIGSAAARESDPTRACDPIQTTHPTISELPYAARNRSGARQCG